MIERGAVEGKVFHRGAVRGARARGGSAGVDAAAAALMRKELIRPDRAQIAGDDAFRFRHLLIRDAAYDALPKAVRAELHERVRGLARSARPELVELDEIAGWHLEQALGYWRELGLPADESAAERAVEHLLAAGQRAVSRGDYRAAENLLERAFGLPSSSDGVRVRVALELADVLLQQGRFSEAERFVDEAEAEPGLEHEAALVRHDWLMHARPHELAAFSDRALAPALAHFERLGDDRLLAKAHYALVRLFQFTGVVGPAIDEALACAEHARRAGDRGLLTLALCHAEWALLFGPTDEATTKQRLADLDTSDAGPMYVAFELAGRATLAARSGAFDEARLLFRQSVELLGQMGLEANQHGSTQWTSRLELESGNPAEAVAQLRRGRDELERLGERAYRSTCTAFLADALHADGRGDEAEQVAAAAEAESAADDSVNFAVARAVRARVAADRGDIESARRLAESALAYAFRMDMPTVQADALCAQAYVLRASGSRAEAATAFAEAISLYEWKGEFAAAAYARRRLADVAKAAE